MSANLINPALIVEKLLQQIESHPEVIQGNFKGIERGDYVNRDPGRTPWCGVYKTRVAYLPAAIGHHSKSWKAALLVKLVVQASGANGADTEDALEDAVNRVMTAVLSDLTVGATIEMLNAVEVEYSYDETESKTMDYQWAFITLTYEARTGI